MPHISSKKLPKKNFVYLYKNFLSAIEKSGKKSSIPLFLEELLTETEKVMLAKRFAAMYLLSKEVPHSYIYESLNMSPATVARMSLQKEIGNYNFLESITKELDENIWDTVETVLRAGLPPIVGRGRWKFLYKK